MKNTVLVDYNPPEHWDFVYGLEASTGECWEINRSVSNEHGGIWKKIYRYFMYFYVPLKIFFKRKQYKKILAWQQFYGLILAFYCDVFKVKATFEITVMTFIYRPKKGVVGKIYEWFMKKVVKSRYIARFIVFSKSEVQYYSELFKVSQDKFIAETLGIDDEQMAPTKGDYYISAGRSNRDYKWLFEAWPNHKKLRVICDTLKAKNSDTITIMNDCHEDQYLKELAACHSVIIPLAETKVSSGQLVIIQALMFGKPVIVTNNDTVYEYVSDGRDGLIIDKSKKALVNAISYLDDDNQYLMMSEQARFSYEQNYSMYSMGKRVGKKL